MATALGRPGSDAAYHRIDSDLIEETFAIFTRLWKPWHPTADPEEEQPPQTDRNDSDYLH